MMKFLGLMFLSALAMIGRLPQMLVPGSGATTNRPTHSFGNRHAGATSTLKSAIAPSTGMIQRTAGLVFCRIAAVSPFWDLGKGPRAAA